MSQKFDHAVSSVKNINEDAATLSSIAGYFERKVVLNKQDWTKTEIKDFLLRRNIQFEDCYVESVGSVSSIGFSSACL